jgi:LysM repeat protein
VAYDSIDLREVIDRLRIRSPAATHYVVFDACRDELRLMPVLQRGQESKKGFFPIPYSEGVLIAYATAPGKTASDSGRYARALAEEIVRPGIEAVAMFRNVALRVKTEIGQDPWISASALPQVYFASKQAKSIVVKPGDTLFKLSRTYRVPIDAIITANGLQKQTLRVAQTLLIPDSWPRRSPSDCENVKVLDQGIERCIRPASGEAFKDCAVCPDLILVPSGKFTMGSPKDESERSSDEEQVEVTIAKPFAVGRYAISFDEWSACTDDGGCGGNRAPSDQGWGRVNDPLLMSHGMMPKNT